MLELVFDPAGYVITRGADRQELLAKEFALLRFLFENRNRAFTREQLLDRVWPLEYPVERTVDDHIYRLRKKLKNWHDIAINTVRGYGYSLTISEPRKLANPSMYDNDMKETISSLFMKYHLFGQGKSMLALSTQQDVLGFEVDPFYRIYIRFIQGDFNWFIHTNDIPIRERLYWLLLLYKGTAPAPERMLNFCERAALATGLLSHEQYREMTILNILEIYAEAGRPLEAITKFEHTHIKMRNDQLSSFVMPVAIMEMYVFLLAGNLTEVERKVTLLEGLLQETPYLREIGRYQIVKGLWLLTIGDRKEAIIMLDEGIKVLNMALNVPLQLIAICQIILYLKRHVSDVALLGKYEAAYDALDKEYLLTKHREELEQIIESTLAPV
ncbi:MAG: winged helix-turn-helix domain-containing protein [Candidatus Pristimantibacillus sp.]